MPSPGSSNELCLIWAKEIESLSIKIYFYANWIHFGDCIPKMVLNLFLFLTFLQIQSVQFDVIPNLPVKNEILRQQMLEIREITMGNHWFTVQGVF